MRSTGSSGTGSEPLEGVGGQTQHRGQAQGRAVATKELVCVAPGAVFEGEEETPLVLPEVVEGDDVGMSQCPRHLDLPQEDLLRGLVHLGNGFALDSHGITLTAGQERLRDALLELYDDAAWAPPSLSEAAQRLGSSVSEVESVFHLLLREGGLVRLRDDMVLRATRLDELIEELQARYAAGDEFSVADFKAWTGVSRKHAIPQNQNS